VQFSHQHAQEVCTLIQDSKHDSMDTVLIACYLRKALQTHDATQGWSDDSADSKCHHDVKLRA
jgi:hypothetical protein